MNFTLKNKIASMKKPFIRLKLNRSVFVFIMCGLIHLLPVSLQAQNSTVSLNVKNATVEEVLNAIESKTEYRFLYNKQIVDVNRKVTVNASKEEVRQVLTKVFEGSGITFSVDGKQIVLRKAEKVPVKQNTIRVTGVVTDFNGQEIVGATVKLEGTTAGTITDIDGKFSIEAPLDGKLNISYIGYNAEIVQIDGKSNLKVILNEDVKALDELVVIGYGTQRRSLVTNAISKVKIDDSTLRNVLSPSQLLDGRVAGVTVSLGSGNLGSRERIQIRGASSITAGNEPLYVVDGVPITNTDTELFNFGEPLSSLSSLNLSDIESIDILKDAASAAIYGSRATNGVVLITTKSGKEGKSEIRVNVNTGISRFPNIHKVKMADSDLYVKVMNIGRANYNKQYNYSIGTSGYMVPIDNPFGDHSTTDWMSLVTQTGKSLNADINFSGGNKTTKYYIGANYTNQTGIMKTNAIQKINLSAKVSHELSSWIEVGANTSGNYIKNNQVPGANLGSTVIGRAIEQRPFDRPYKPNGNYYIGGTDELTRHNAVQVLNEQKAYIDNYRYLGTFYSTLKLNKKLSYKYSLSTDITSIYDYKNYYEKHPYGSGTVSADDSTPVFGNIVEYNSFINNLLSDNLLTYNDKLSNLEVSAMLGQSFQKVSTRTSMINSKGFPSPTFDVVSAAALIYDASGNLSEYAMESYFGRVTLSWLERYILSGTLRTDGSSKFAPENRWGWFPSVSLGWNVSEEDFMKDTDTDLKIRASYGKTGNQAGIGNYAYQSLMSAGSNYREQNGILTSSFGNKDLKWETADQYDAGFDLGFLKGKINIMFDVYLKNTHDLLYSMPTPATTGKTSMLANVGSMRNYGSEFTFNTHFKIGEVQWLTQFNIATNQNKITSLLGDDKPISIGSNRALQVGKEMGIFYIFKQVGIFQYDGEVPQEQYDLGTRAGDVKWYDADGNNIINDNDRQVIGSSVPDFFGGWNNTFKHKGWQLDIFFSYMYGNDVYAQYKTVVAHPGYRDAVLEKYALNYWDGPGSTNIYPRIVAADNKNNRNSDRWLEDGSFIRLRALTLSYNLPKKVLSKVKLKGVRLYAQGDNLWLLTRYSGWDPEVNSNMDPQFTGNDNWNVPQPRMFSIGANINL